MLAEADFEFVRRLVKERSGLALTPDKAYLVTTRLRPLLEKHRLADVAALVRGLRAGHLASLTDELVDAMTTNESLFFRDRQPFEALVQAMLPELMRARPARTPIRIWCAAASTGQEPYSISILLEENAARFGGRQISILASDLSQAALRRARLAEYTAFEVGRGMPPEILERYFTKLANKHFVIKPAVRARVSFQQRNLLEPFDRLGPFDIVFCRNVLIYFDRPTKADVLSRLADIIPADGYLVLGGPETTLGLCDRFSRHPDWRNVYVRPRAAEQNALSAPRLCA